MLAIEGRGRTASGPDRGRTKSFHCFRNDTFEYEFGGSFLYMGFVRNGASYDKPRIANRFLHYTCASFWPHGSNLKASIACLPCNRGEFAANDFRPAQTHMRRRFANDESIANYTCYFQKVFALNMSYVASAIVFPHRHKGRQGPWTTTTT